MSARWLIVGALFVVIVGCAAAPPTAAHCSTPQAAPVVATPRDPLEGLSDEELALRLGESFGSDDDLRKRFRDVALAFVAQAQKPGRPADASVIENVSKEDLRELRLRLAKASLQHYDRRTLLASVHFFESKEGKTFSKAQAQLSVGMMPILFDWMKGIMARGSTRYQGGG